MYGKQKTFRKPLQQLSHNNVGTRKSLHEELSNEHDEEVGEDTEKTGNWKQSCVL